MSGSFRRGSLSLLFLVSLGTVARAQDATKMRAHFIDVGQGSATLLEFKCGAILIDSGTAPKTNPDSLRRYLDRFFQLRPDLHRTLNTVFLTHCHIDHAAGLNDVVKNYTVKAFVDDGVIRGSGKAATNAMLATIRDRATGTAVQEVFDHDVRAVPDRKGLTSAQIDGLKCDDCDPDVRVLAGGYEPNERPTGWSKTAFENLNNHSLVIRASLGKASVLITGDLENDGLKRLTDYYGATDMLTSEILVAGHHGAGNGITPDLIRLVSPMVGIISCGRWEDGRNELFSTYAYGHPSKSTVDLLSNAIARRRTPLSVQVGLRAKKFEPMTVRKAIFCTGWDDSIVVDASTDGTLRVTRHGLIATR